MAEWPRLAPVWADLYRQSGSRSFFLTEEWTETWLETFAGRLKVSILVFESEQGPAGICLLTECTRRPLLRLRRLSLNAAGEAVSESTYIEHNNVLCRPGWETAVARRLAAHVLSLRWDEFALDGMQDGPIYQTLKRALSGINCEEESRPCHYADLLAPRRSGTTFEACLRGLHRKNLRRSIRQYATLGPLRLERAAESGRALEMFEELGDLSRRRMATQGRTSTFEAPRFLAFHHRLIARCFGNGSIDMLRLTAGSQVIGVLYDLIQAGKVHEYQGAFRYPEGRPLSPGIVAHALAIQYCLDRGLDEWDFLAGGEVSKRALATSSRNLFWTVFRRTCLRTRLLAAGRKVRRWLRRRPAGTGSRCASGSPENAE